MHKADGENIGALVQPPNIEWNDLREKIQTIGTACDWSASPDNSWLQSCSFGDLDSHRNLVLYGDSHSTALSYKLNDLAKDLGYKVILVQIAGCVSVPYIRLNKNLTVVDCESRFETLLRHMKTLEADIIITNRWTFKLYPIDGIKLDMPYRNSEGFVEKWGHMEYDVYQNGEFYRDQETKSKTLSKFISKLSDAGKRLFVIYPVPETGIDVSKQNWKYWNSTGEILQKIDMPYNDYVDRNAFVISVFDAIDASNVIKLKVADLFCNRTETDRCDIQNNGIPYYLDDDHLGDEGARLILDRLQKSLN